ncbi:Dimethylaniline monooxygenase [Paramyrothecium foliicola]|nr:Dimethylaniline monooxygenase [Paramyrothecium foliicola]
MTTSVQFSLVWNLSNNTSSKLTRILWTLPAMDHEIVPIAPSPEYLEQLAALVHDPETLRRAGYVLQQLSALDLQRKRRCRHCHRALKSKFHTKVVEVQTTPRPVEAPSVPQLEDAANIDGASSAELTAPDPSKQPCRFHTGTYFRRAWTCCNGPAFSKPCHGEANHEPRHYRPGELENDWKYYSIPWATPKPNTPLAVAIDCEMGTAECGDTELIRISVIDYFSGSVLLDRLVYPHVKMAHYNTAWSGVTRKAMEDARRGKACLFGRNQARKAVYELIGPKTIIVGHGAHGDLSSLRLMHAMVIDTFLLEQQKRAEEELAAEVARVQIAAQETDQPENTEKPAPAQTGGLSLKALAQKKLNRVIQVKGRGHDSTEDAMAARDLLHWHIKELLASGPLSSVEEMA